MIRKIIEIDSERCNGCGLCVTACHEGAIGMENGKAKLLRDDYCDGLGDCLPVCPTGAITFTQREALAYNESAVRKNKEEKLPCGCPGTESKAFTRDDSGGTSEPDCSGTDCGCGGTAVPSQLGSWPVQIKLVPVNAPYFDGAELLIAADCSAYAYGNFHNDFMRGKITLIGCPKLDSTDYSEKLTAILKGNNIKSVTVVRMEVPCCMGLEVAVRRALENCGKNITVKTEVISTNGNLLRES